MLASLIAVTSTPDVGQQAMALARRLERANDALIAALERAPEVAWQAADASQGWCALAEARGIAEQLPVLADFVEAIACSRPLPQLRSSAPRARGGKDETLALLRRNGAAAARILGGLSDEQLARGTSCFGTRLNAAQLADELLIAALDEHRAAI